MKFQRCPADSSKLEVGDFVVAIGNPFAWDKLSLPESSAHWVAVASGLKGMKILFKPMHPSIRKLWRGPGKFAWRAGGHQYRYHFTSRR